MYKNRGFYKKAEGHTQYGKGAKENADQQNIYKAIHILIYIALSFYVGNVLLSRAVTRQVSSTLKSLTSVFGMGTGVPSLPSSPTLCITFVIHSKLNNIFRIFRFSFLSFILPYSLGQALDLLVQLCLICYHTYTRCLSTT